MDRLHDAPDPVRWAELAVSLRQRDEPDVSSPRIDVLEAMAVDGLQMGKIEVASGATLFDALAYKHALGKRQRLAVADFQSVSENDGSGIALERLVTVVPGHSTPLAISARSRASRVRYARR